MNTNDYFLKLSEYCNFNLSCIDKLLSDKKKLANVLGITNKKELDNVWYDISVHFDDYVFRNYKKFPKDEVVQFLTVNMCNYNLECMLEKLKEYDMQDMLDYVLDYWKKNKDKIAEYIVNMCNYDMVCILEQLKENNMQDMLDYVLDYWSENYDIEPIVKETINGLLYSDLPVVDLPEDSEDNVFALPVIAWLEFYGSPEALLLMDILYDEVPSSLAEYFTDMGAYYESTYEDIFGGASDDIINKIYGAMDKLYSRAEDRLKEIAKEIYDKTLDIIKNNPSKYEIVGYMECNTSLCYLLGLDKIPLVRVNENTEENELLNA